MWEILDQVKTYMTSTGRLFRTLQRKPTAFPLRKARQWQRALCTTTPWESKPPSLSGGAREGQAVRTGKALPSAFGRKRRNELRGRLCSLCCLHSSVLITLGRCRWRGSCIRTDLKSGLLSQLLFIICAFESLEIKFLLKFQSTVIYQKEGLGQVVPSIILLEEMKERIRITP